MTRHSRQQSPLLNEYTPSNTKNHNKSFNSLLGSNQQSYRRGESQGDTKNKFKRMKENEHQGSNQNQISFHNQQDAVKYQTQKEQVNNSFQKNSKFKELSQQVAPRGQRNQSLNQQNQQMSTSSSIATQNEKFNSQNQVIHVGPIKTSGMAQNLTGSNLSTMRNANQYMNYISNVNHKSPSTVKMGQNLNSSNQRQQIQEYQGDQESVLVQQVHQDMGILNGNSTLTDISNINNASNNYSCIIMRSNEKQGKVQNQNYLSNIMNSSSANQKENYLTNSSFMVAPNQFNQRLDELEADAHALQRSMLDTSHLSNSGIANSTNHQSFEKSAHKDYKTCKKQLQKLQSKYQQIIKEHSTFQHDNQLKELQIQRLLKEVKDLKEDSNSKDYKLKQLRYENDRLFNECSTLKNIQAMQVNQLSQNSHLTSVQNHNAGQETQQHFDLESENLRKKVKRLTGEMDVMETYFDSLSALIKQQITQPESLSALQKVFRSLQDSIDFVKELFSSSKLNVTQGKRVQRKIRYEKLKTEFQQLIIQLAQSTQLIEKENNMRRNKSSQRESTHYKSQIEQLQSQIKNLKVEHQKRVDQYKEQVKRMRENTDLFKENMKSLKQQNEDLQSKLKNGDQNQLENQQFEQLFTGLKQDNDKLVEELKRIQDENKQIQNLIAVSKETIQQQNGVITGLQSVIEKSQNQIKPQAPPTPQIIPFIDISRNDNSMFQTNKYPSGQIISSVKDSARIPAITMSQERSKSVGSSVEQIKQRNRQQNQIIQHQILTQQQSKQSLLNEQLKLQMNLTKPILLHQSAIFPQNSLSQNLKLNNHDQSVLSEINLLPISPEYQQVNHNFNIQNYPAQNNMNRSLSNLSLKSAQNRGQIRQQYIQIKNQPSLMPKQIHTQEDAEDKEILRSRSANNVSMNCGPHNQLDRSALMNDSSFMMNVQDQSVFNDSFIRYLTAEQKLNHTNILQNLQESEIEHQNQSSVDILNQNQQQLDRRIAQDKSIKSQRSFHNYHHDYSGQANDSQNITPVALQRIQQQAQVQHNNNINNSQIEGCMSIGVNNGTSPMTARFSSFQNQMQKQQIVFNNNDISRLHIKENTKSILGEISDIDQEIVALQSTLLNVYGNNLSNSNIDNSLKQKNLQKQANETNMQPMQMLSNNMSYMNDVSQNMISDTNLLDESNQQHQFLLQSQLSQNNNQEHQNLNSFQNFQNQHLTHANQLSSTKQLTGLSLGGLMTSSAQQRYNAEDICQQTTTVNGLLFNDLNMNSTVQQQNIHAIQRTIDFEGNQTQDSIKSNSRYGMMSANTYKQGNNNATQNLQNSYLVGQNVNDFSLIDEYIYENQDQRNDGCSIIQFQNEEEADNSQLQQ